GNPLRCLPPLSDRPRCSTARKGRDRHVLRDRVRGSGGAVCRCSLLCTPPRGQHYLRPVDSPAGPIRVGTAGARPVAVPRTLVPRLDRVSGLRRRDALYVPVGRGGDREGALCGGGDVPVPWCPARACLPLLSGDSRDGVRMARTKSRFRQLTDEQWERIEPLLPSNSGRQGHPFRDNRKVVEGIIYRYRTGIPWRDLPREEFGPW